MKILAPVSRPDEVAPLLEAGADELYCGVLTREWDRTFTNVAAPNRVERHMGNLAGYELLEEIVRRAHAGGGRINFTLNALFTQPQFQLLEREVPCIVGAGVDAILVADLGVFLYLRSLPGMPELHLSTGGTVFNSEAARFFTELGATRIVLPRSLRPDEITRMVTDNPDIPFEVFVLNGGCVHVDGFCTFHHGLRDNGIVQKALRTRPGSLALEVISALPSAIQGGLMKMAASRLSDNACGLRYHVRALEGRGGDAEESRRIAHRIRDTARAFSRNSHVCGACSLIDFLLCRVHAVKIVGRTFGRTRKVQDVRFIAALRARSGEGLDAGQFRALARTTYKQHYGTPCGENCLYP